MSAKRWCGRAAAGTESAAMNPMVEAYGDPDEGTPYVLASDYEALEASWARCEERCARIPKLEAQIERMYRLQAQHTVAEGMLMQERDRHKAESAALREALVRAHDTMLMVDCADLGRSDRDALYAAREHAKAVLGTEGRSQSNCIAPNCNCPEGRCAAAEGAVNPLTRKGHSE